MIYLSFIILNLNMYLFKTKEFPDETKSVEFIFDNGININRLRSYSQSSNKSYLLYENYGNPNYIDVSRCNFQIEL